MSSGNEIYLRLLGHITKMAAWMPIYGKNLLKNLIWNLLTDFHEIGDSGPLFVSNDDLVDLALFYDKVKFRSIGLSIGKVKTRDFSETIAACGLKVGRYRQLIKL